MASKKPADPAVADSPVLGDNDALFSQPAEPVPVVAGPAVHMKRYRPSGPTQQKFGSLKMMLSSRSETLHQARRSSTTR